MTAHDELRARAEAATPGPWRHDGRGSVMALPHSRAQALPGGTPREVQLACVTGQAAMHGDPERDPAELRDATAAYIAAASPDVVLSLLAEIAALRAERAAHVDRIEALREGLQRVAKRCAEGGEQALAEVQCTLAWDDSAHEKGLEPVR